MGLCSGQRWYGACSCLCLPGGELRGWGRVWPLISNSKVILDSRFDCGGCVSWSVRWWTHLSGVEVKRVNKYKKCWLDVWVTIQRPAVTGCKLEANKFTSKLLPSNCHVNGKQDYEGQLSLKILKKDASCIHTFDFLVRSKKGFLSFCFFFI